MSLLHKAPPFLEYKHFQAIPPLSTGIFYSCTGYGDKHRHAAAVLFFSGNDAPSPEDQEKRENSARNDSGREREGASLY